LGAGEYHRLCFDFLGFFGIAPLAKQAPWGRAEARDARWGRLHD
jgi:hypothetical protein